MPPHFLSGLVLGWVGLDSSRFRATNPGGDGSSKSGKTVNDFLDAAGVRNKPFLWYGGGGEG